MFPLKVVEYMTSGCIVVVRSRGCSERLIADGTNGIIAESGSVVDVAKSMMRAFSDEKLAAGLRGEAGETVEKVYD